MQIVTITLDDLRKEVQAIVETSLRAILGEKSAVSESEIYLTRRQVAELLDIDLSTLYNWCKSGKLNPVGIGKRVYFLQSDIVKSLRPVGAFKI